MFPIVKKRVLNETVTLMEIEAPLVARKALPGQFIIFRIDEEGERIPLTIAGYDREKGTVTIIFQKVGYTTMKLDTLNEGDALLDFVGPLGEPSHTEGVKRAAVIGGGLGVDYEGTRSQSDCSVNYGLNEYANNIIWAIGDACEENGLPHPTVITESGRAVTAHHTVLVSNIIGVERNEYTVPTAPAEDAPRALQSMWETWQEMHEPGTRRSLREWLHDSQMDLHDIHIGYSSGTFSLQERAWAEQLYLSMCHEVQKQLDPQNRAHRPIIDELQERMADKMYVNFSLFQSMPDAWGIDQLFPVLPLEGLDQVPERRAVLLDITCDSDGAIDHYIDGDGIATTMPMPEYDPENPPMLGFFMVGAYQEILGNMHNLFGDTEAVDVFVFPDGSVEVELSDEGDTVADMLQYVQLDPKTLLTQFRDQVKKTDLDAELQQQFLEEFEAGLYGYTYLEDE